MGSRKIVGRKQMITFYLHRSTAEELDRIAQKRTAAGFGSVVSRADLLREAVALFVAAQATGNTGCAIQEATA